MLDKNGVEIRTGDVVLVTGAYFKNDNGLFMVERSPGDIGWSGGYHSLMKITKSGKVSTAKYNLGSWPIAVYVSNWAKKLDAKVWNAEHAEIEVVKLPITSMIAGHFLGKAQALDQQIEWTARNWGEANSEVVSLKELQAHFMAVAARVQEGG